MRRVPDCEYCLLHHPTLQCLFTDDCCDELVAIIVCVCLGKTDAKVDVLLYRIIAVLPGKKCPHGNRIGNHEVIASSSICEINPHFPLHVSEVGSGSQHTDGDVLWFDYEQ